MLGREACRGRIISLEQGEGVLVQPTPTLDGGEPAVSEQLESLVPGEAVAIEGDVMDTFAVCVEEVSDDGSATQWLHVLEGQVLVGGEANPQAEGASPLYVWPTTESAVNV